MSSRRLLWSLVIAAATTFACAEPQGESMDDTEAADAAMAARQAVEQAMNGLQDAYVTAYNAGDAAGVAALFAEDGTQAPPNEPARSPAEIEAGLAEQLSSGPTFSLTVEREDMVVGKGRAAAWGGFTVTMTPPDGDPQTFNGRWGTVIRQEPDGTWKIIRHLYNYENPPPAM